MHKSKKILALNNAVLDDVSVGKYSKALNRIKKYVLNVYDENLCTGHLFGLELLDELCQKIGQSTLSFCEEEVSALDSVLSSDVCVYLISRFQRSGGHSRVLESEFKNNPNCQHLVFSTEEGGRSDVKYIDENVLSKNVVFEYCTGASSFSKLIWLQSKLLSYKRCKVFVFNHHFDSVIISALQPAIVNNGFYYHHADHHLALGLYLKYLTHIDPHPMGFFNCRHNLGIDNYYVPLTAADMGQYQGTKVFRSGDVGLTTCTAARANKVSVPYVINYFSVILELLKNTNGKHIHIGWLPVWTRAYFAYQLHVNSINSSRFIYIPWVKSISTELEKQDVDLYISSFPYTGALTLIEVARAGIPIALHEHYSSHFLSCIDMFNGYCFQWQEVEKLIQFCNEADLGLLQDFSLKVRLCYEKNYKDYVGLNQGKQTLQNFTYIDHKQQPMKDEYYIWLSEQFALLEIIRKFVMSKLRYVKPLLNRIFKF